jgi:putative phosphoesterase
VKRIGLLSDTHGYLHPRVSDFFKDCHEIWHAGDIGEINVALHLSAITNFRAVHGNIDSHQLRQLYPENLLFECEGIKVFIRHIGGYPGRYARGVEELIKREKPGLFVSGHSHILKIMPDKKHNLLHINPGAAGIEGFHQVITFVRFVIDGSDIKELEIKEIERKRLPSAIDRLT